MPGQMLCEPLPVTHFCRKLTNGQGQLATTLNTLTSPVPIQVTGLGSGSGFIAVAAGGAHALALKSDGSVWVFSAMASILSRRRC